MSKMRRKVKPRLKNQRRKTKMPADHQDEKRSLGDKSKSSASSVSSSETSSIASKSVYQVEGDDDDEWATLVKFDTELFKKEKEL